MKKTTLLLLLALVLITYFACTRTDSQFSSQEIKDPFVKEAVSFLKSQVSSNEFHMLDFVNYSTMKTKEGEVVGARFTVKNSPGKFAIVGKTANGLTGNWVDVSKLSFGTAKEGVLATSSFSGDKSFITSFSKNRIVKISKTNNGKTKTNLVRYNSNGEKIMSAGTAALASPDMEEYEWYPDVTVQGYIYSTPTSFYSLFYYFNYNSYYTYTYQTIDPYQYGYGGSNTQVFQMQAFEFISGPKTNLQKLMNCFNNVPTNANTTYSMTLHADLPDNTNPEIVAVGTTPGHAFITLTKTNGSTSVSQTFGFYPLVGSKSIAFAGVDSKIVNDVQHEYNASITINLPESEFNIAKSTALANASLKYDLNDFNCTDYAVGIFNSVMVSGVSQLNIPDFIAPAGVNYKTTPNGLYKKLRQLKLDNDPMASNITLGTFDEMAGGSECN